MYIIFPSVIEINVKHSLVSVVNLHAETKLITKAANYILLLDVWGCNL